MIRTINLKQKTQDTIIAKKWQEAEFERQRFKIMLNDLEKDTEVVNIQMHEMHMLVL